MYKNIVIKWCESCQINYFKQNSITNWNNGNEKIDNLIQEMQLTINSYNDTVLEWIPYSQFNDVIEISNDSFATIYSAIWKDGPLNYDDSKMTYTRKQN